jgi:hypothetical protein
VLDEAEVEEADPAVAMEEVVAGVRVAVESVHPVDAAKHESEDRFGGQITLVLRPLFQLGEARAVDVLGRQDARRRQFVDDGRHVDEGMTAVVRRELPLIRRLVPVVELFGETRPQLLDERDRIEAGEHHRQHAEDDIAVDEVGADRFVDARILHLHRDFDTGLGDGAVDLADRRGGNRLRVPSREELLGRGAELGFDD